MVFFDLQFFKLLTIIELRILVWIRDKAPTLRVFLASIGLTQIILWPEDSHISSKTLIVLNILNYVSISFSCFADPQWSELEAD